MDKAAITYVLEQLGPKRVERGLVAFTQPYTDIVNVWQECFLGRALGITEGTISERLERAHIDHYCDDITAAFDSAGQRPLLHALILEWLEANRAPTKSAPPEVAHVSVSRVPVPV